jgi:hypothetical protein
MDEGFIKSKTVEYLPPTSGMVADGHGRQNSIGQAAYDAYLIRAVFPEAYSQAIKIAIGIMHNKPPIIQLPKVLEPMLERCNTQGDGLNMLLRRINAEQLTTGRVGLLGDFKVSAGEERPLLYLYNEVDIRNWDDGSNDPDEQDVRYIVLDESRNVMEADFSWSYKKEYRVLALVGNDDNAQLKLTSSGVFKSHVFSEGDDVDLNLLQEPNIKGANLTKIPFAFINANDLSPLPDLPPLMGLANTCLTIYRGEADYRQNLFMQGQDTLVRIGGTFGSDDNDDAVRTGACAVIDVPQGGDAKYIGVSSAGLGEQREALANDYRRAGKQGGELLDATKGGQESGEALKTRVAAQTATLQDIALTGAAGLQAVLRTMAEWFGADPAEVVVTANTQFADSDINGQTLSQIVSSKMLGAPISFESIHAWAAERGVTDKTFEEEMRLISKEAPIGGGDNFITDEDENKDPKERGDE